MQQAIKPFLTQLIIVGIVILGAGFYAGNTYAKRATATTDVQFGQGTRTGFQGANGQGAGRRGGAAGGGFVSGAVLSKDTQSITVKMRDGSTKIVFVGNTTQVGKMASGTPEDLVVGAEVMVQGPANPDGSVSAQSVQIRPQMARPEQPTPAPAAQ